MNTILFVTAAVVLALVILAKLPGLEHTVKPMIGLVFTALQAALENAFSWSIWGFKVLWSAHTDLFRNLMLPASALDPSFAIRENSDESP